MTTIAFGYVVDAATVADDGADEGWDEGAVVGGLEAEQAVSNPPASTSVAVAALTGERRTMPPSSGRGVAGASFRSRAHT
jgi:hypothetical protein